MIEAGESPEPELIEQIAAAGEEAVEPLLDILRSKPRDWPAEAPLSHAIGLLRVIRHPAAIPELIEIVKCYPDESGDEAAEALASYGEVAFDPLLEMLADPALRGYSRDHAITAAMRVAGTNATRRVRLAEVVRPMLRDAIERAMRPQTDEPTANEPQDDGSELDIYGEISFLASDLAGLADPLARDLIDTAFANDLIDASIVDKKFVDKSYASGGDPEWIPDDWLALYRDSYLKHLEFSNRPKEIAAELREMGSATSAPVPALQATIRKKEPAVGRNDPCWCGSGKKFKKCHLGK